MILQPLGYLEIQESISEGADFHGETIWLGTENWLVSLGEDLSVQRQISRYPRQESWSNHAAVQKRDGQWNYYPLTGPSWELPQGHSWFMISEDKLLSTDGYLNLSFWDRPEAALWTRDLPAGLSAYASAEDRIILGFTNGSIHILDRQGNLLQHYEPGGSRISMIYGLAINPRGTQFAVVSGLSPQRILVLEEKNSDYRPIFHHNLDTQNRRPVYMGYPDRGNFFYYETQEGVSLYYPGDESLIDLKLSGHVIDLHFDTQLEAPVILINNQGNYRLEAYLKDRLLFSRPLQCSYARLYQRENSLLLVQNDTVTELQWSGQ